MSTSNDFAKRVSERIRLALEQASNQRESERVAALDAAHLQNPDSKDFVQNLERRISNALLEEQAAKTSRLEDRVIAEDLERANQ